jgi:VanZ family protein
LWISIGIGAGTGALLEFGQYFMALGRSFELADMLANALGASVGAWAGFFLYTRKKVKRN